MQIHYAYNPVTSQWLRSSSCISPDAVLELIDQLKLEGYIVTSCSMPDHLFQQYKNIMDAHNDHVFTSHLLESGIAPPPANIVQRTEKSRLPEIPAGVDRGIKDREALLTRFRYELKTKMELLPQLEARLEAAKADTTGRVVLSEVQAVVDTIRARILYLQASIEDDGKDRKPAPPAPPVAAPVAKVNPLQKALEVNAANKKQ